MQFTLSKLIPTIVLLVSATIALPAVENEMKATVSYGAPPNGGVPVSATLPSPSDFDVGQFWTAANRGGNFANVNVRGIPSSCFDIISSFDNKIASIQIEFGINCTFFTDHACEGPALVVQNFVASLQGTPFENNLSAYACVSGLDEGLAFKSLGGSFGRVHAMLCRGACRRLVMERCHFSKAVLFELVDSVAEIFSQRGRFTTDSLIAEYCPIPPLPPPPRSSRV